MQETVNLTDRYDYMLLSQAGEARRILFPCALRLHEAVHKTLERAHAGDWIKFIDVAPAITNQAQGESLHRVFYVTDKGLARLAELVPTYGDQQ